MVAVPDAPLEDQTELDCDEAGVTCPLYDWMEENLTPAVEDRDTAALARLLHQVELLSPNPEWSRGENGWARIARRGAVLTEQGDFDGARRSCRDCHRTHPEEGTSFRAQLRRGYRLRPMPELGPGSEAGDPGLHTGD